MRVKFMERIDLLWFCARYAVKKVFTVSRTEGTETVVVLVGMKDTQ